MISTKVRKLCNWWGGTKLARPIERLRPYLDIYFYFKIIKIILNYVYVYISMWVYVSVNAHRSHKGELEFTGS